MLSTLCAFLLISTGFVHAQQAYARKGEVDLRKFDLTESGPINLQGEWEFYMSEIIPPDAFAKNFKPPADYIDFPSTWNHLNKSKNPGFGFATYRLKLFIDHKVPLAMELPHFYSNFKLFINGSEIARNGIVAKTERESMAQWLPMTINLETDRDSLDIVIHVSNFHHAMGGIREPILIGDRSSLQFKRSISRNSNLGMVISLGTIGLIFALIYLLAKKELSLLYFSGLTLVWSLREAFSNQYLATSFNPDLPWEMVVKIEYISLFLMMIFAMLFLGRIFAQDVNAPFKYVFCFCNAIFVLLTLFLSPATFTQFLPVYLSFSAVLLLYITFVLVRAIVYERTGVWFMVTCLFLGVIIFAYDIIAYEGFATFNPIITNVGYLVMFMLMAVGISYQTGLIRNSNRHANILTYDDLYGERKENR